MALTRTRPLQSVPAVVTEVSPRDLARLRANPQVARVYEDEPVRAQDAEGGALIKHSYANNLGYTGSGITVAVVDSGVDITHPALSDDLVGGRCFLAPNLCPGGLATGSGLSSAIDGNGHGTAVAGIITGNGSAGVPVGVAPAAKIFAYRVLDSSGVGFTSDIIAALDDINANHPEIGVVNLSVGGSTLFSSACDGTSSYTSVINALTARGTLVVASAGNSASSTGLTSPGCVSNAISVGAVYDANVGGLAFSNCTDSTTTADKITCYSNSTTGLDLAGQPLLDVLAPSHCALTAGLSGGTTTCFGGTSAAAPYVSGALAVLRSAGQSASTAATRIKVGASITDTRNGLVRPRIDLQQALGSTTRVVNPAVACSSSGPTYCTIQSAIDAASPNDLITVAAGTYNERLTVSKVLTINGASMATTIVDGEYHGGTVTGTASFVMSEVTIRNGGPASGAGQSGVRVTTSGVSVSVTLTNVTVRDSSGAQGAGIHVGAGVSLVMTGGSITGNGIAVPGNSAVTSDGGGLWVGGSATLVDVTVSNNTTYADGGGIYICGDCIVTPTSIGSSLAMTRGSITGNHASAGGGVMVRGQATFTDVTVSNNAADGVVNPTYGGGVAARGRAGCGTCGDATLTNLTVTSNSAPNGSGGGVFAFGQVTVTGGTVAGNSAGSGGGIYNTAVWASISLPDVSGGELTLNGGLVIGTQTIPASMGLGVASNQAGWGAGLYNAGYATVVDTTIRNNWATGDGGGVLTRQGGASSTATYPTLSMTRVSVSHNRGLSGGGVWTYQSRFTIADSAIFSNSAGSSGAPYHGGGGVYVLADHLLTPLTQSVVRSVLGGNCIDLVCNGTSAAGAGRDVWVGLSATTDLRHNWWGCSGGPVACGDIGLASAATADASTWIATVEVTPSPASKTAGQSVTLTATRKDNTGATVAGTFNTAVVRTGVNPLVQTNVTGNAHTYTGGSTPGSDTVTMGAYFGPSLFTPALQGSATVDWHSASPSPALSGLTISAGTLSPAFAQATTSYTVSVANGVNSVTVTPTLLDPWATMTVQGTAATSGAGVAVPLNVGPNTITIVVTPDGGGTARTYTVTVTRAASAVSSLSGLTVSSGTLTPSFATGTTSYMVGLGAEVTTLGVTATTTSGAATLTVGGTTVASGVAAQIPIPAGSTSIAVVVTAEDGVTRTTYTVTATRSPSAVATLTSLGLSAGSLTPAFASGTASYAATLPASAAILTVTPAATHAYASVRVNGTLLTGATRDVVTPVGASTLTVLVTAEDGIATQTYTVSLTRPASGDASLASLGVSGGAITPAVASGILTYSAAVTAESSSVTVTPTHAGATIRVNGAAAVSGAARAVTLVLGANAVTIVVTAEDGTVATYALTITRSAPPPPPPAAGGGGGGGGAAPPAPTPTPAPKPPVVTVPDAGGVRVVVRPPVTARVEGRAPTVAAASSTAGTGKVQAQAGAFPPGTTLTVAIADSAPELQRAAPPPERFTILAGFQVKAERDTGGEITSGFAQPVHVEFTLQPEAVPRNVAKEDLGVFYWDGTTWIEVLGATVRLVPDGTVEVSAQVTHFTLFSVMHRPAAMAAKAGFRGVIAPSGVSLALWSGGSIADATATAGVRVRSLWVFREGVPIGYIAGAPDFVNQAFLDLFPGGAIPDGSLMAVVTGD